MAVGLKPTNFNILHSRKPYKLLNNFSSSTTGAAAVTATVDSRKIFRRRYFGGWWCRTITPCAFAAHSEITSQFLRSRKHFYTSDSRYKGQDGGLHRSPNNNLGTQMGATVNGKVQTQYSESDVSSPQNYDEKPRPKPSKLLTLPTILTIGRVGAVPLLVSSFYVESWWGPAATTGIFIAAAVTDWLEGYLARKMKLGTQFGAFLDPVADKLMVAATLILLCTRPFEAGMFGQAPWLLTVPTVAIIGREITMSAVREWAASQDRKLLEAVAVNNLGKWKTATQMTALTILLAARDGSLVGAETLASSGVVLLYISAWLSLWSLVVYMRKIWKVLVV
ncbi:CDP-alcohol phosphatidyltransferase/Phosphatidylglycerol-phosphate synthase [Handroanthus impetiginosus]|uniref:CDP-diacylglycerol--glycerol-3-phosphate 1-phosphatidyltransferase n=1 Tax=Handroanthus impetiginosus TaxID=429701 RepID=A0A2G9GPR6_9LAMI|nr:CDP-alcohol phosphatidyltransferase/Phosphatidylglycerol-phosphate synthase [Handroanthus impetiginosus]